ncbi:hypothetical protein BDB01DRAFT_806395 [Pilobolus umbonatus]|nr:hypothetical protein BDB01DRAFT_806395 [Pilobolus umbonatus]
MYVCLVVVFFLSSTSTSTATAIRRLCKTHSNDKYQNNTTSNGTNQKFNRHKRVIKRYSEIKSKDCYERDLSPLYIML